MNLTFYRRNRHHSGQKVVFLQLLQYSAYSTKNWRQLQYVTNTLWKIERNHTNRLFVVWVWVNLIQLEICSYLSWGDKSAIFLFSSTLICLLSSKYCFCLCCANMDSSIVSWENNVQKFHERQDNYKLTTWNLHYIFDILVCNNESDCDHSQWESS